MTYWSQLLEAGVLKKSGIYVFSSWVSQSVMLLAWMILPWRLSAEELGQFALISFGVDLVNRLILMGTDSAILRFYVDKERREQVLRAVYAWMVVGFATALGVLWLTRDLGPSFIEGLSPIYTDRMWLVLATAAATAFATVVFTHHIASGDAAQFGKLTVLRSAILGTGYVLAAWLGFGVAGLICSQLVASLAVVVSFYAGDRADQAWSGVDGHAMREVGAYGLPMVAYTVFALLGDYTGRLALGRQVSLTNLGVFQFYYQIASQVNGLWGSINRAWTPHIFQQLSKNRPFAFNEMFRATILFSSIYALVLAVCMLAGAAGLWSLVVPPAFSAKLGLLYVLLLGPLYTCIYVAMYPAFYYQKNTVRVSLVQSLISVATIIGTIYLTVKLQADGAAFGWVLGTLITPFVYLASFPKFLPELKPMVAILSIWAVAGGLMVFAIMQLGSTLTAIVILLAAVASLMALQWEAGSLEETQSSLTA